MRKRTRRSRPRKRGGLSWKKMLLATGLVMPSAAKEELRLDAPWTKETGLKYRPTKSDFKPHETESRVAWGNLEESREWTKHVSDLCARGKCKHSKTDMETLVQGLAEKMEYVETIPAFPETTNTELAVYQGPGYKEINLFMRTGISTKKSAKVAKPMIEALEEAPVIKGDFTVYRGAWGPDCTFESVGEDMVITNLGFLSTSTNPYIALSFMRTCMLSINLKGSQALRVPHDRDEAEIIVKPGTSWKVVGKPVLYSYADNSFPLIHVEVYS